MCHIIESVSDLRKIIVWFAHISLEMPSLRNAHFRSSAGYVYQPSEKKAFCTKRDLSAKDINGMHCIEC